MAIKIEKTDVAQRTEQGSSKAKVAGSSPAVSAKDRPTYVSDWAQQNPVLLNEDEKRAVMAIKNVIPATPHGYRPSTAEGTILQKHKERLAYNAAYQRDLRTIKRLGLNCTVAQYRAEYGEKK